MNEASKTGQMPAEYLLEVMRSPMPRELAALIDKAKESDPDLAAQALKDIMPGLLQWRKMRQDAAKDAAPYFHPRLQQTTVKGDPDDPLKVEIVKFADNPDS